MTNDPSARTILGLGWLVMFISAANWLNYSPLIIPIAQDFGITFTSAGLLITASSIAATVLLFPSGLLADRYGAKRPITVFLVVLFFSSLLSGYATDYSQLFIARLLSGFAAPLFPLGARLVANWYPERNVGLAQGIFAGAFAGGVGVAAVVMPVLATALNWRGAFMISSLSLIPLIIAFWLMAKEGPGRNRPPSHRISLSVLRQSQVWPITLLNISFFATFLTTVVWLPSYFSVQYGLSIADAGIFASVGLGLGVISRPLGGITADKFGRRKMIFLSAGMATLLYGLISMRTSFTVAVILALLIGWFSQYGSGALISIPPILFPKDVGTVIGFVSATGQIVSLILPPIIGYLVDTTHSFSAGFMILAMLALLGVLATLRIKEGQ